MAVENMGGRWKGGNWEPNKGQEAMEKQPSDLDKSLAEWDNQQTTKDLTAHFQKKFPQIQHDFKGFDAEILRETLKEFERNATEYPEVAQRLQYVGQHHKEILGKRYQQKANLIAYTGVDGKVLVLKKDYYKNKKRFDLLRADDRNYLTGTRPKDILAHEFGHLLDKQLGQKIGSRYSDWKLDAYKRYNQELSSLNQQHRGQPTKTIWQKMPISRYAGSSPQELIAESYSQLRAKGANNQYTKELSQFIHEYNHLI